VMSAILAVFKTCKRKLWVRNAIYYQPSRLPIWLKIFLISSFSNFPTGGDKKGPSRPSSMKAKPITNNTDKKISRIEKMTSYPSSPREGAIPKSVNNNFMQMVAPRTKRVQK
jgi:hypothetical protein